MTSLAFVVGCLILSIPIWIIAIAFVSLAETAKGKNK